MFKLAMRTLGMVIGLLAGALMLIVDILYSLAHTLSKLAGFSADTTHFFIGLLFTIIGVVGAFLADPLPNASIVFMLVAAAAFFFIVGLWAIIPAIFFALAIVIIFLDRGHTRG